MGTRHIIKVRKNGKDWVSQYGQWDGYPTGQGTEIVRFLSQHTNIVRLDNAIDMGYIVPLSDTRWSELMEKLEKLTKKDPVINDIVNQMFRTSVFSRDTGAKCLYMLTREFSKRYTHIAEPSGWEEYMYTIDLDSRTLKVEELDGPKRFKVYDIDDFDGMSEEEIDKEMKALEEEWKDWEETGEEEE